LCVALENLEFVAEFAILIPANVLDMRGCSVDGFSMTSGRLFASDAAPIAFIDCESIRDGHRLPLPFDVNFNRNAFGH
jgi:hypothetical protein